MANSRPALPLRLFVSYSHRDDDLRERFLVHLDPMRREGLIAPWHDRRITAGTEWVGAIDENLEAADLIVLLVSPDFLASDYCNDVEMKRALERVKSGEARIVPVILKPCDWETSRFAGFEALPKDAKPVVDWQTSDHGLVDAVQGLRRVVVELCGPGPVAVRVVKAAVRRRVWRWAVACVLLAALGLAWAAGRSQLGEGVGLLNKGQYAEALPALKRARYLMVFSGRTRCAYRAAELGAARAGEQAVAEAVSAYPECAYLRVLRGDGRVFRGDLAGALADYRDAVRREPGLGEAHFGMGNVLDRLDQPDSAVPEYEAAVRQAPDVPRYRHDLADLFFKSGAYDRAVEQYERMGEFPLAALDLAKIYRLQGRLDEAAGRDEDAIRWLREPSVVSREEGNGWIVEVSPLKGVRLGPIEEKRCYADLELAMTRFLAGDERWAAQAVAAGFEKCSSRRKELSDILRWELHRLGSENAKLGGRSDQFAGRFLGGGF
ncbi:MAG: TIR domain-containing protein [Acidobacteriaceae bacterium]|nr:TIR domain-containing protein [Acidobacteriaceae bacterium]